MSGYFPKSKSLGANAKVELELSNCATKADLFKWNRCWYIRICLKNDLANLKSDVDE